MNGVQASPTRIVLVRHGRPTPVAVAGTAGWLLDADAFGRWCAEYARAELAPGEAPPAPLAALVRDGARVVASDLPRAAGSAALLAPLAAVRTSPLLREAMETVPPVTVTHETFEPLLLASAGQAAAIARGEAAPARTITRERPDEHPERDGTRTLVGSPGVIPPAGPRAAGPRADA